MLYSRKHSFKSIDLRGYKYYETESNQRRDGAIKFPILFCILLRDESDLWCTWIRMVMIDVPMFMIRVRWIIEGIIPLFSCLQADKAQKGQEVERLRMEGYGDRTSFHSSVPFWPSFRLFGASSCPWPHTPPQIQSKNCVPRNPCMAHVHTWPMYISLRTCVGAPRKNTDNTQKLFCSLFSCTPLRFLFPFRHVSRISLLSSFNNMLVITWTSVTIWWWSHFFLSIEGHDCEPGPTKWMNHLKPEPIREGCDSGQSVLT